MNFLQPVFPGDWEAVRRNFEQIERQLGDKVPWRVFTMETGHPENEIVANIGDKCRVLSGGPSATWFTKVADNGLATGWRSDQTS